MKKLKVIILSIAIIGMFTLPMNVMADEMLKTNEAADGETSLQDTVKYENTDSNLENISDASKKNQEETTNDSQKDSVNEVDRENSVAGGEDAISEVKSLNTTFPNRSPAEKNFTLTKMSDGIETKINDYDKFSETVSAMDINDVDSLYTIYVNRDVTIPKTDHSTYRSNNKIRLTSKNGEHFTLTREGEEEYIAIQTNAELTVDNITLDGNNESECLFISDNGKVTIGAGAVVQNFIDLTNLDGPAIYMTGGTLNILDGAVIQNNSSNQQGGGYSSLSWN